MSSQTDYNHDSSYAPSLHTFRVNFDLNYMGCSLKQILFTTV